MWDVLGLEPTTDRGAVRRAYAARLKSIDVDRDPAAFIRLRLAYERCLEWEGPRADDSDDDYWDELDFDAPLESPEAKDAEARGPPPPFGAELAHAEDEHRHHAPDRASVEAANAAWLKAEAEGDFETLEALYLRGLVAGFIPLGEEHYDHATVVRVGAEDLDRPFSDIQRFALAHDWPLSPAARRRGAAEFGDVYAARLAAEDWYEGQVNLSRDSIAWYCLPKWLFTWTGLAPSPSRAARVLLGKVAPWRLREEDAPLLKAALDALRRHAPYLGKRFNPKRAARLDRRVDFLLRKGALIAFWRFFRWLFGMLAVLMGIFLQFAVALGVLIWLFHPHQ